MSAITLERLATDKRYQGMGIGTLLLLEVFRDVYEAIEDYGGIESLVLVPLDDEAREWYLRRSFGFRALPNGMLELPAATLREAVRLSEQS